MSHDDRSMYSPGQGQRPLPPGSGYGNPGGGHKEYDPSINVSARANVRSLATLANAFAGAGQPIRSISSLIHDSLDEFVQALVRAGAVQEITSYNEALYVLQCRGLYTKQINRGGKGPKGLGSTIHAAHLEDVRMDAGVGETYEVPDWWQYSPQEYAEFMRAQDRIRREATERDRLQALASSGEERPKEEAVFIPRRAFGRGRPSVPAYNPMAHLPISEETKKYVERVKGGEKPVDIDPGPPIEGVPLEEILDEGPGEAFLEAMRRAQEAGVPPPVSDPD